MVAIETTTPVSVPARKRTQSDRGLRVERYHTHAGLDVFKTVQWTKRTAAITGEDGRTVFEQKDIEVPESWSQLALNVVASKYFRGHLGTPERETSVRRLIARVADTIAAWGKADGLFATDEDAAAFRDELMHLLLHQKMAFNSPVWFNVGVEPHPQSSACFINSVDDTMESIMELAATEARLFKGGSGTGSNLSRLRSSKEKLSGGGTASGPVSFMRGFDSFAGVIKSGGKTRRAAKMVILNVDHPDIMEFVRSKAREEKKAHVLVENGYSNGIDGEAYSSVFFQNANHSIRATDEFMQAAVDDRDYELRAVKDGTSMGRLSARAVLREAAEATWVCGDPGVQFDTTINKWHTCTNTDRIYASNPCSEFMFLDDTACNLASLNLLKFVDAHDRFDVESFNHAVATTIIAQEILVDNSSYPTARIAKNSHDYRPLGLGYANLGALLMAQGLPYDSDAGRAYAGAITAVMCGTAYETSARIAGVVGPFAGYEKNRASMLGVVSMHKLRAYAIPTGIPSELLHAAQRAWDHAYSVGDKNGYRNAQVTVLAPTGTIAFMMDCDTTGIEPDIALVKHKSLVGGGVLRFVNQTVPRALEKLGYSAAARASILDYIEKNETIEGSPDLKPEHLPVFDCAFRAKKGTRSIAPMGHVKMMAAAQPFLSGAISKTVNVPEDATVDDIYNVYFEAWKLGLKAIAVYRDGCKKAQPLSAGKETKTPAVVVGKPVRRALPAERDAKTHKFSIGGHEGYVTVGKYDDGTAGELFITMSKEGSTISGLMDTIATLTSIALQYGVPLETFVEKFSHMRFEPSGFTGNKEIPVAKSVVDYIFRWMGLRFLPQAEAPTTPSLPAPAPVIEREVFAKQADAPSCSGCGTIMVRAGSCYACPNCAATSGCS